MVHGPSDDWHPSRKAALLLAYLAIEGPTPRERLAGLLWPERAEGRARANLRQLLLRARQRAPIVQGTSTLALAPGLSVDALGDADEANASTAVPALLPALDASDTPELGAWLRREQERIAERARGRLRERGEAARQEGDLAGAVRLAEELARLEPWSEAASRTVMELALEQGEPAIALKTFARLRATLEAELGVSPTEPTLALAERAARIAAGILAADVPMATVPGLRVASSAEAGGWLEEGARLLRAAVPAVAEPGELGRVLIGLAWLEHRLGHNDDAEANAEHGLALLGDSGEAQGIAQAGFVLGSLAWARGSLGEARERWYGALRSLPDDDPRSELRLTFDLALVEDALGNQPAARQHYLAARTLARASQEHAIEANILNNLGHQLVNDGLPQDGRALLLRARGIARALRDRGLEGYVLDGLARAAMAETTGTLAADEPRARAASRVSDGGTSPPPGADEAGGALQIGVDTGDVRLQIEALLTLADTTLQVGANDRAGTFALAALRRSARARWRPLVAAALVALARTLGHDDDRGVRALRAVASDPAAGRYGAEAKAALRDRGFALEPVSIDEVLETLLGSERGVTLA